MTRATRKCDCTKHNPEEVRRRRFGREWFCWCARCGFVFKRKEKAPMKKQCPSCPDGNEWDSDGPTGRACRTCNGKAWIETGVNDADSEIDTTPDSADFMPERGDTFQ